MPDQPNLFVSKHPAVLHKLALLRDERTDPKKFRELVREISWLVGYEALAESPQPDAAPVNCYQMQPVKLALDKVPTRTTEPPGLPCFQANLNAAETNVHVIHKQEPEYTEVMTSVLKNLLTSGRYDSRN